MTWQQDALDGYPVGSRVRLIYTADGHTRLRPGDLGTVIGVRVQLGEPVVSVRWDSGSMLAMVLSSDDQIEPVRDGA